MTETSSNENADRVKVRRDTTWQKIADGLVTSSDGEVRLRIVERTDGMFDIVQQTATGTICGLHHASERDTARWELNQIRQTQDPVEVAALIETEHGRRSSPEDCTLQDDVTNSTEQAALVTDGRHNHSLQAKNDQDNK